MLVYFKKTFPLTSLGDSFKRRMKEIFKKLHAIIVFLCFAARKIAVSVW